MKNPENLYRRGTAWYYKFKMHGRKEPYRGSCFTHDVRKAKEVLREKMAEVAKHPGVGTVATTRHMLLSEMRERDFRRMKLKGSEPRIIETTIGYSWRRLMQAFEHAGEITLDALTQYVERHLDDGTASRKTLREDLQAAKRGYEWAAIDDRSLPALGKLPSFKRDKPGKGKGELVPHDILDAWLGALSVHARAKALVTLTTGIRWKELARFEKPWLSTVRVNGKAYGLITLPDGKTKNRDGRTIIVVSHVAGLIRQWAPFAVDPQKAWNTASKRAGFHKGIYMRDLRKTFASNLGRFDWPGLCMVMGHKGQAKDAVPMLYQASDTERLAAIADEVERVFGHLF